MMKVNILCNSELSIPSIQWMISQGIIQSIGIPDVINPYHGDIKAIALQSRIPLVRIHKESLAKNLKTWLEDYPTSYVFVMTFPFIIPKECLTGKDIQWLNFHPGKLPDYRGPEPIFWSQRDGNDHYYKRPGFNDVRINWQIQSAREIKKLIKSCNPWNKGAITSIKGMEIRFVDADLIQQTSKKARSQETILEFTESGILVQCKDDKAIRIDVISWSAEITTVA